MATLDCVFQPGKEFIVTVISLCVTIDRPTLKMPGQVQSYFTEIRQCCAVRSTSLEWKHKNNTWKITEKKGKATNDIFLLKAWKNKVCTQEITRNLYFTVKNWTKQWGLMICRSVQYSNQNLEATFAVILNSQILQAQNFIKALLDIWLFTKQ